MARAHVDPEAWAKKVKRRWIIGITLASVLLVAFGTNWLLKNKILPARRNREAYARAEEALAQGNVKEAIDRFSVLWDYEDAKERAAELAGSLLPDDSLMQMARNVQLGEHISFGSWEQDGDLENGPEPISWLVLAEDDGRILLWADYVLDAVPFHDSYVDITWADCSLRTWLNETFYRGAFTEEEQVMIPMTYVENPDNSAGGTKGGEPTEDHVYILSLNELAVFARCGYIPYIYTLPTPYAASRGVETHEDWETCCWWLRTPGSQQNCVSYCAMNGNPMYSGVVNRKNYGVRPVIWLFAPGRVQAALPNT